MISESKTAQVMLDKASAWANSKGYNLITKGTTGFPDKPDINETYILEQLNANDTFTLGLAGDSDDRQDPIYELSVYTPKSLGKWRNLEIVDEIKAEFNKGAILLNDGVQCIQIQVTSNSPFMIDTTHGLTVVSINITVIA